MTLLKGSIAFLLVVRNVGNEVEKVLNQVDKISQVFEGPNYLLVYENDSTDNTLEVLNNYEFDFPDEKYIFSEKLGPPKPYNSTHPLPHNMPCKNDHIAIGRNLLLEKALSLPERPDYLIMLDGDSLNHYIDIPAIKRLLTTDLDKWDYVSAVSSKPFYFDFWTLRTEYYENLCEARGLNPNIMLRSVPWGVSYNYQELQNYFDKTQFPSQTDFCNEPFHPVLSAFGGLGIFKSDSLMDALEIASSLEEVKVFNFQKGQGITKTVKRSPKFTTTGPDGPRTECEIVPFLKALKFKDHGEPYRKMVCTYLRNGEWPGLPK